MAYRGENLPAYTDTEALPVKVVEEGDQHKVQLHIRCPIQAPFLAKVHQKLSCLRIVVPAPRANRSDLQGTEDRALEAFQAGEADWA